jgi:FtsH-binding integral membrane protein
MSQPLDVVPLWAFFAGCVGFLLACMEAGLHCGRMRGRGPDHEKEPLVGAIVAAVLGLVAFILGFTFQIAATRFEARRSVVVEEANAVGTAWLRAGMLPAAERAPVRALLREYVEARLEGVRTGNVEEAVRRSEETQSALWSQAEAAGRAAPDSEQTALFVESINRVIDSHGTRRFLTQQNRLPVGIWIALFGLTALGMAAMGYLIGLSGSRRSPAAAVLAVALSVVIWMIADLDRPFEGGFRVGQEPLARLSERMQRPAVP